MKQKQFLSALSKLNPSSTFLTLSGYKSENEEVADYNIIFHINYENALKRSVAILEDIFPETPLQIQARNELLDGYNKSLINIAETINQEDNNFEHFYDLDGNVIKGVKKHTETGAIHIYGLFNNKRVVTAGTYKTTNKRPLTIAKDRYRRLCPVSKFRQFVLTDDKVDHISVGNLSLLPPEAVI